jgi:hypothetical protein
MTLLITFKIKMSGNPTSSFQSQSRKSPTSYQTSRSPKARSCHFNQGTISRILKIFSLTLKSIWTSGRYKKSSEPTTRGSSCSTMAQYSKINGSLRLILTLTEKLFSRRTCSIKWTLAIRYFLAWWERERVRVKYNWWTTSGARAGISGYWMAFAMGCQWRVLRISSAGWGTRASYFIAASWIFLCRNSRNVWQIICKIRVKRTSGIWGRRSWNRFWKGWNCYWNVWQREVTSGVNLSRFN